MMRKLLVFSLSLLTISAAITTTAQVKHTTVTAPKTSKPSMTPETQEKLMDLWFSGIKEVQDENKASDKDFATFIRFNQHDFDQQKSEFCDAIKAGKINFVNASEYKAGVVKEWNSRYAKFLVAKKEYPSSVAEYESKAVTPKTMSCNPSCDNIDFEAGTLTGWDGYYAYNSSTTTAHIITSQTGGPCGPVTQAGGPDTFTGNDYQIEVTSGAGVDAFDPAIPVVSPFGGKHSVRLGDSTRNGAGVAILQQQFMVTASNANFTYQYAVLLENPAGHNAFQQPFFNVAILDQLGDTIPFCGNYSVYAQPGLNGFKGIYYPFEGDSVYCKNWTVVAVPLKKYIGQCVTVIFEVLDCSLTGHFGYAYVDASCAPLGLIASSPALCGQKTITLTAPPGATKYTWTGPTNGIVGSDSTQTITVDSSGTYTVILTPITGSSCNDTISINVGNAPGPPPHPNFHADTICAGQPTLFTNLSSPITGANFYWDFYNLGSYNDTVDVNPIWTYSTPGTYTVKLHEVYNGCGADTTITVKVDSSVATKFTNNTACVKQTVFFTNTSGGATKYLWNFGDPSSGTGDTSTMANPQHVYDTAGTYTVTLIGKNNGPCPDTIKQTVNVLAVPIPKVTGTDTICPFQIANFTASGGTTYTWTGGVTCPSCAATSANPGTTTTYTVNVSNGFCSADTTWTVVVRPVPVPTITAKPDTICIGDSTSLIAGGGPPYSWSTGSTKDTIRVAPATTQTYTLQITQGGCTGTATKQVVVVGSIPVNLILRRDSICPYDSTYLVAQGGASYKWLPSGITTDSIKAKPGKTTTYTVVITNACGSDTLKKTLTIVPLPAANPSPNPTICSGDMATISVNGGGGVTYSWSNGATTSAINVGPLVSNTTYTCTVSNGKCQRDTTVTVIVKKKPTGGVSPPYTMCVGGSVTLCSTDTAKGLTYKWSNGATTSCITVSPGSSTSYTLVTSNGCADTLATSVTVNIPSLSAFGDTTIQKGDSTIIYATGDSSYVWTPGNSLSCTTCPDPTASPTVTTTYTVTGTDANGCSTERTVLVIVEVPCADFVVPNVFTPNDDGRNDDFVPYYYIGGVLHNGIENPTSYSIVIYDRWGKEVYKSSDPTVYWNGRITNTQNLVPDGVYYYIIKASCGDNNYTKDGFVTVLGGK